MTEFWKIFQICYTTFSKKSVLKVFEGENSFRPECDITWRGDTSLTTKNPHWAIFLEMNHKPANEVSNLDKRNFLIIDMKECAKIVGVILSIFRDV